MLTTGNDKLNDATSHQKATEGEDTWEATQTRNSKGQWSEWHACTTSKEKKVALIEHYYGYIGSTSFREWHPCPCELHAQLRCNIRYIHVYVYMYMSVPQITRYNSKMVGWNTGAWRGGFRRLDWERRVGCAKRTPLTSTWGALKCGLGGLWRTQNFDWVAHNTFGPTNNWLVFSLFLAL